MDSLTRVVMQGFLRRLNVETSTVGMENAGVDDTTISSSQQHGIESRGDH